MRPAARLQVPACGSGLMRAPLCASRAPERNSLGPAHPRTLATSRVRAACACVRLARRRQ